MTTPEDPYSPHEPGNDRQLPEPYLEPQPEVHEGELISSGDPDLTYRRGLRDGFQLSQELGRLRAENEALSAELAVCRDAVQHWKKTATIDPLTGKPNRLALTQVLTEAIEEQPGRIGLLFGDLDGLKEINDTRGHNEGDEYIKKGVEVLDRNLRTDREDADVIGRGGFRLAGDEIVGVVTGIDNENQLENIKDRLLSASEDAGVRISIGYALHQPEQSPTDLIQAADTAMYGIKEARRTQKRNALRDALDSQVRSRAEEIVAELDELGLGVDGLFGLWGRKSR